MKLSNLLKKQKRLKKSKAFTLVELIVVITILAILSTIAFIALQWYTQNSRDSKRIADIGSIQKSLEIYITEKWKYPIQQLVNILHFQESKSKTFQDKNEIINFKLSNIN